MPLVSKKLLDMIEANRQWVELGLRDALPFTRDFGLPNWILWAPMAATAMPAPGANPSIP